VKEQGARKRAATLSERCSLVKVSAERCLRGRAAHVTAKATDSFPAISSFRFRTFSLTKHKRERMTHAIIAVDIFGAGSCDAQVVCMLLFSDYVTLTAQGI
jgi:hypothetical protein